MNNTFEANATQTFTAAPFKKSLLLSKRGLRITVKYLLSKLPEGELVTLIAFTKNNGQLFHCKKEFIIQKNKTVKLDFKNITAEEMNKM